MPTDPIRTAPTGAGPAASHDLRALLGRFLDPIVRIAGAQAGAVRVLDGDGRHLHLAADSGLPQSVRAAERVVEHDCGACGAALHADGPLWAASLAPCVQRNAAHYFGRDCQGVLAVPLRHGGRVLGVCTLFFDATPAPAPAARALLEPIGALLGAALDHSRQERERLCAAALAERQALAADVHDSIGQSLAFVRMRLPLLQDAIEQRDRENAGRYFADLRLAVGQAHASLRGLLTECRTPMPAHGLAPALDVAAQAFRRDAVTALEVSNELPALQLTPECETQVYHVVQEALTNIARHAAAAHAWLRIAARPPQHVQVVIEDDGSGLGPAGAAGGAPQRSHYGLAIMGERARRLGGTLSVGARSGGGTRVELEFPIPAATVSPELA